MSTTDSTTTTDPTTDFLAAFGATSTRIVSNSTVDIPDHRRQAFAQELAFFSGQPNTVKRELVLPTEADAVLLRAQLKSYAGEHNVGASFPDRDKFGRLLNSGCMVTYRFSAHRAESTVSEVAVTTVADAESAALAATSKK